MNFVNFYSWLKYTTVTPSSLFKNRIFIEKIFRNNHLYVNFGDTQKSFSWIQLSNQNIVKIWTSSNIRLLIFVVIAVFFIYNIFIIEITSTALNSSIYFTWRFLDNIYFFVLQFQYLFLTTTLTVLFTVSNYALSSKLNLVAWMQKNHAEIPFGVRPTEKETLAFSAFIDNLYAVSSRLPRTPVRLPIDDTPSDSLPLNLVFKDLFTFKYLRFMDIRSKGLTVNNFGLLPLTLTKSAPLTNNSSLVNSDFFLQSSITADSSVNLKYFSSSRSSFFKNYLKFFKITRWISIYGDSVNKNSTVLAYLNVFWNSTTTLNPATFKFNTSNLTPSLNWFYSRNFILDNSIDAVKLPTLPDPRLIRPSKLLNTRELMSLTNKNLFVISQFSKFRQHSTALPLQSTSKTTLDLLKLRLPSSQSLDYTYFANSFMVVHSKKLANIFGLPYRPRSKPCTPVNPLKLRRLL